MDNYSTFVIKSATEICSILIGQMHANLTQEFHSAVGTLESLKSQLFDIGDI